MILFSYSRQVSAKMAVITDERQNSFPFMKLSAELRLMIYRMALRHEGPLLLSIHKPKPLVQEEEASSPTSTDDDVIAFLNDLPRVDPYSLRSRVPAAARQSTLLNATTLGGHGVIAPVIPQQNTSEASRPRRTRARGPAVAKAKSKPVRAPTNLVPAILCLNRQIYREARSVLYSENIINLELDTSIFSVNSLRQPTRSLLKHIHVSIASYHDILDGFSDLVRLGLRYCWGLQVLTISLPGGWPNLPSENLPNGKKCTGNVYANAFHILRWLPKTTKIILEGDPSSEIKKVVEQCGRAAEELDEVSRHFLVVAAPSFGP